MNSFSIVKGEKKSFKLSSLIKRIRRVFCPTDGQIPLYLEFTPLPKLEKPPSEVIVHYNCPYGLKKNKFNEHKDSIRKTLKIYGFGGNIKLLPHYGAFRVILLKIGKIFRKYGVVLYSHNFTESSLEGYNVSVIFYNKRAYKILKKMILSKHRCNKILRVVSFINLVIEKIRRIFSILPSFSIWFQNRIPLKLLKRISGRYSGGSSPQLSKSRIRLNGKYVLLISSSSHDSNNKALCGCSLIKLIVDEIQKNLPGDKIEEILISSPLISDPIIKNLLQYGERLRVLVNYEQSDNIDDTARGTVRNNGEIRALNKLYHRFIIIGDIAFILSSNLTIEGTIHKIAYALLIKDEEAVSRLKRHFNELWNQSKPQLKPPASKGTPVRPKSQSSDETKAFIRRGAIKRIVSKPRERKSGIAKRPLQSRRERKESYPRSLKIELVFNGEKIAEISQQTQTQCYILTKEDKIELELVLDPLTKKPIRNVEIHIPNTPQKTIQELQNRYKEKVEFDVSTHEPTINIFIDKKNRIYEIKLGLLKISMDPDRSRYLPGDEVEIKLINGPRDRDYKIILEDPKGKQYKHYIPKGQNSCKVNIPDIYGDIVLFVEDGKGNKYGPGIRLNIGYIGRNLCIGRKSIGFYVRKVLECLQRCGKVIITARGGHISKAVNIAEIVRREYNANIEAITTDTEEIMTDDGEIKRVSVIEITVCVDSNKI